MRRGIIAIGGRLLGLRLLSPARVCAPFRESRAVSTPLEPRGFPPGDFALATWKARSSDTRPGPFIRELDHPDQSLHVRVATERRRRTLASALSQPKKFDASRFELRRMLAAVAGLGLKEF